MCDLFQSAFLQAHVRPNIARVCVCVCMVATHTLPISDGMRGGGCEYSWNSTRQHIFSTAYIHLNKLLLRVLAGIRCMQRPSMHDGINLFSKYELRPIFWLHAHPALSPHVTHLQACVYTKCVCKTCFEVIFARTRAITHRMVATHSLTFFPKSKTSCLSATDPTISTHSPETTSRPTTKAPSGSLPKVIFLQAAEFSG